MDQGTGTIASGGSSGDLRPIHYIGNKSRYLDATEQVVGRVARPGAAACDLFAGTSVVTRRLAQQRPVVSADDIATLTVYVEGMTTDEIVAQLDCGGAAQRGTLVRVPPALYPLVVPRVPVPHDREWSMSPTAWFLRTRCSDEFLRLCAEANDEALPGISDFGMMMDAMWEPAVLARLNQAGALPEEIRLEAIARVTEFGIEDLDPGWADPNLGGLFTANEYADLLSRVKSEVVDSLESRIDEHVSSIYGGLTRAELYQTPRDYVDAIRGAFADNNEVLQLCTYAENYIADREVDDDDGGYKPAAGSGLAAPKPAESTDTHGRDPFEDVAAGH